jgi:hypothetical protein
MFYSKLAGVTRHCLGHITEVIMCITLRSVLLLLWGERQQGRRALKYVRLNQDICNFTSCHVSFTLLTRNSVEGLRLQSSPDPILGPLATGKGKGVGVGSKPDALHYWKGALQLLFYKLYLKMIDHGSRSTWDPGPSRSRCHWRQSILARNGLYY